MASIECVQEALRMLVGKRKALRERHAGRGKVVSEDIEERLPLRRVDMVRSRHDDLPVCVHPENLGLNTGRCLMRSDFADCRNLRLELQRTLPDPRRSNRPRSLRHETRRLELARLVPEFVRFRSRHRVTSGQRRKPLDVLPQAAAGCRSRGLAARSEGASRAPTICSAASTSSLWTLKRFTLR
jgi:hypothetical protein